MNYNRIYQTFLYFGVLLTLIAVDWRWYLARAPKNSIFLQIDFLPVLYAIYGILTAGCFVGAIFFHRKANLERVERGKGLPKERGRRKGR